MNYYFRFVLPLKIFLLFIQPSFAQKSIIRGEVKDPYGRPEVPAGNIYRIERITIPPYKYDAAGF